MSIFSRIRDRLYGNAGGTPGGGEAGRQDLSEPSLESEVAATLGGANAEPAAMAQNEPVDVAAIMDAAVTKSGQKLDWRRSIVDMLKALDLDSSLSARKELAAELGFSGDTNDSVAMNTWLHKALMKALADNGGKVPAELLD